MRNEILPLRYLFWIVTNNGLKKGLINNIFVYLDKYISFVMEPVSIKSRCIHILNYFDGSLRLIHQKGEEERK